MKLGRRLVPEPAAMTLGQCAEVAHPQDPAAFERALLEIITERLRIAQTEGEAALGDFRRLLLLNETVKQRRPVLSEAAWAYAELLLELQQLFRPLGKYRTEIREVLDQIVPQLPELWVHARVGQVATVRMRLSRNKRTVRLRFLERALKRIGARVV